jgi:urease accessory protein UreE
MGLANVVVKCLNEHLYFVSNAMLANCFVLGNRHLRQAKNRYIQL